MTRRRRKCDLPEVEEKLQAIYAMSRDELVGEWRRHYRAAPPERVRRDLLELGVAWKLQEKLLGGFKRSVLSNITRMAEDLNQHGEIRKVNSATIKPGARLIREWSGRLYEVTVLEDGYLFEEKTYKSLSSIASEITGVRWSGPRFFGLVRRKAPEQQAAALEPGPKRDNDGADYAG